MNIWIRFRNSINCEFQRLLPPTLKMYLTFLGTFYILDTKDSVTLNTLFREKRLWFFATVVPSTFQVLKNNAYVLFLLSGKKSFNSHIPNDAPVLDYPINKNSMHFQDGWLHSELSGSEWQSGLQVKTATLTPRSTSTQWSSHYFDHPSSKKIVWSSICYVLYYYTCTKCKFKYFEIKNIHRSCNNFFLYPSGASLMHPTWTFTT